MATLERHASHDNNRIGEACFSWFWAKKNHFGLIFDENM